MSATARKAAVPHAGDRDPSMVRLWLRRFVLTTSVPPLLWLYREGYAVVIRLALRIFRRYPEIKAVYLRRGAARGRVLPLVSDIDFAVIGEPLAPADRADLENRYHALAQRTTLLDKSLQIHDETELRKLYATDFHVQYRFTEGKANWKLLHGEDILQKLPTLSREELYGGCYVELQVWWTLFTWRMLQERRYADETVTRNTVCFKTVSEIVKIERALEAGALIFDRVEALRGEVERLNGEERAFAEKLLRLEQKGFRPRSAGIVDETLNVTLRRLDAYYGRFRRHRFGAPDTRPARPSVAALSSPLDERLVDGGVREYAAALAASLPGDWGETYRGARMVQSVHFNIDEWLLVLDVDPQRPPPAAALTRLNVRHMTSAHPAASRVQLFLRLRNAAFQTDVVDLTKSWQSILNPSANRDVYHALGCADAWVGPQQRPAVDTLPLCEPPVWTPVLAHFFRHEKMLFRELLDQPAVYKLASLDFLRVFWKMAQLIAMNRSATTDRVLFPMTPGAIRRALDEQDVPMPSRLAPFEQAYRRALRAEASDVSVADLVPDAVRYLKEIDL